MIRIAKLVRLLRENEIASFLHLLHNFTRQMTCRLTLFVLFRAPKSNCTFDGRQLRAFIHFAFTLNAPYQTVCLSGIFEVWPHQCRLEGAQGSPSLNKYSSFDLHSVCVGSVRLSRG